jgi:hypothetical protein
MNRATHSTSHEASEREALRRRVKRLYEWFNQESWDECFSLVDPRLKDQAKVKGPIYRESLQEFKQAYGKIAPWYMRISLHLGVSSNKQDERPFAYVYVIWQDAERGFHMFRERWVKDSGRWFTRVVGLVPNRQESVQARG